MGRRAIGKKPILSDIPGVMNGDPEETQADSQSGPQPIDLGDMAGLKRCLDDCALNAVLDAGYQEDHLTSNVKISIGSITIAVALIAQFYPKKHPDNWAVLLMCLVLYCIGSTFLSLFSALYEEDACFITRPKQGAGNLALRVSSRLPRYSDQYTISVSDQAKHKPNLANLWKYIPREGGLEQGWSLTQFYDVDGVLHEELFKAEIQKLVAQCERQHKKSK